MSYGEDFYFLFLRNPYFLPTYGGTIAIFSNKVRIICVQVNENYSFCPAFEKNN